jgi:hypothetical protein
MKFLLRLKNYLSAKVEKHPDFIPISLIVFIAVISHAAVFFSQSVLTSGDWQFRYQETATEYAPLIPAWRIYPDGLGAVNINAIFYPINVLYGWLLHSFGFAVMERALFFYPMLLVGGIGMYYLAKRLIKNNLAALIASLLFTYNSYFIVISASHPTIAVADALTPLLFLYFFKYLEGKNFRYGATVLLLTLLMTGYEFRILFLAIIALTGYVFFSLFVNWINRKGSLNWPLLKKSSLIFFLFFGLSSYWLVGQFKTGSLTDNAIFDRILWGNQYYDILHALAFHYAFWNPWKRYVPFTISLTPIYYLLFPVVFSLALLVRKKRDPGLLYFCLLGLAGVFLTKQTGYPLKWAYQFLYEHFPGFNAFREASKFYIFTAVSYPIIVGFFVKWLLELKSKQILKKVFKYAFLVFIIGTISYIVLPLALNRVERNFSPRQIPADYTVFKNFIHGQPEYFRTLWVPIYSRWSFFDNSHPWLGAISLIQGKWSDFAADNQQIKNQIMSVLRRNYSGYLADLSSIRYVAVPIQDAANNDDFFISYGGKDDPEIRNWYLSELDKVKWLKRIDIGTKDLAVYENDSILPPIHSFTELYGFDSLTDLENKYDFIARQLDDDNFNFTVAAPGNDDSALVKVDEIFGDLVPGDITDSTMHVAAINPSEGGVLYIRAGGTDNYASYRDGQIIFYSQNKGRLFSSGDGGSWGLASGQYVIQSVPADTDKKYYVITDDQTSILGSGLDLDLGSNDQDKIAELATAGANIIPDPSFEDGLWQPEVGDCNHFDDQAAISMALDGQDKTDGNQSLRLEAAAHIACTYVKIPIDKTGEYLLSFDYESPNLAKAGYYLSFNDEKQSVVRDDLPIVSKGWQNYQKKIIIPPAATAAKLYLYSYAPGDGSFAVNRYDNFQLAGLTEAAKIYLPAAAAYLQTDLAPFAGNNIFAYQNEDYDYDNIIPNPSFESGFWNSQVGDCNHYDDNPEIAMRLDKDDKSQGVQSLELEASRHIACSFVSLPVRSGGNYLLSFDYQSYNAATMSYYLGFNDSNRTIIRQSVPIKNNHWNEFSRSLSVPNGATQVTLYVYARSADGTKKIINRYDNFRLVAIPAIADDYYLVSEPKDKLRDPAAVDFTFSGPAKRLVHIKGAATPFFLAFAESYHHGWQLEMNNEKINGLLRQWWPLAKPDKVAEQNHYKLDNSLNSWYVDPAALCRDGSACIKNSDGSYDLEMTIEFWPQRWFYLGLIISFAVILFGLGCLIYCRWHQKYD